MLKFIYFEKTTKFCEIFTLLLTGSTLDKSKVEILHNFVAFSEYMNFKGSLDNTEWLTNVWLLKGDWEKVRVKWGTRQLDKVFLFQMAYNVLNDNWV